MNIFEVPFPELHMGYLYAYVVGGIALAYTIHAKNSQPTLRYIVSGLIIISFIIDATQDIRYPIFSLAEVLFGYVLALRFVDIKNYITGKV